MFKLGMNSGLIADGQISASSSKTNREPIQARAPVDQGKLLYPYINVFPRQVFGALRYNLSVK